MLTLRRIVPVLAVLLLVLPGVAQTITQEQKDEILQGLGKIVTERAFVPGVDMSQWETFVEKHREAIDKTEGHEPFVGSVNRALREFGLSHMRLRSPVATRQRQTNEGVGLGVGATPSRDKEEEGLRVDTVVAKGPAESAGLQPGDRIVEIDGKKATDNTALRGEEGSEVKIKVARPDGSEKELTIKRGKYSLARTDTLTWPEEDVAVLKIHTFSRGYETATIKRLVEEAAAKAKYLIIDLRSNGGGATNNLRHMLGQVLPAGTVVGTFVSRRAATDFVEAGKGDGKNVQAVAEWWSNKFKTSTREPAWNGKIAVLLNRGSASASEIAAAALRETAGAPLVGEKTAGAVLASVYGNLPHGFSVQYPINDYVTVKGVRLEKNPIEPDVVVASPRSRRSSGGGAAPGASAGAPDAAVLKAIELLRAAPAGEAAGTTAKAEPKAEAGKESDAQHEAPVEKKPETDGKGGHVLAPAPWAHRRQAA